MSLHAYLCSQAIAAEDPPFDALLFALIRKADSTNTLKLQHAWPELWAEMLARYNAPGGVLAGDNVDRDAIANKRVLINGAVVDAEVDR